MVEALEKKFNNDNVSEIAKFISSYKAPRSSRASKPSGTKRVANPYVLWLKDTRQAIVDEHFDGVSQKASEVTKKAATIWKEMSDEDKKPWVEKNAQLKEEAGQSPISSPASDWNFEKKIDVEVPEGWSGPHIGKYLAKSAAKGRGVGRFATFEEAVAAAEALGNKCGGITLEQKAYTVRVGNDPIKHPNPAQSTYSEASWTKDNFEPELAPKSPKASKKKTAKAEEPNPDEVEAEPENEDAYNQETDDEDETEVERWTFNEKIYLLDPTTNEVYDAESCELIGKKGEGAFAEPKKIVKKMKVAAAGN